MSYEIFWYHFINSYEYFFTQSNVYVIQFAQDHNMLFIVHKTDLRLQETRPLLDVDFLW